MDLSTLVLYIGTFWLVIMMGEFLYSLYKQDGIYIPKAALGNCLRYILILFVQRLASNYHSIFFITLAPVVTSYGDNTFSIQYIISCVIILDFCSYIYHRAHHVVGFLRPFHHVHHSDRAFNMTTAFRFSALQILYSPILAIPLLLLGYNPGVILLAMSILSVYQTFTHSAYIRLPRFFDYVFVTPHNHRIHHDQAVVNQNSNFGGIFSIWDRLFGTYVSDIKEFTPGIKGYSQDNFIMMEVDPIVRYLKNRQKLWSK
jgi:alkylglycerol monooxygenase